MAVEKTASKKLEQKFAKINAVHYLNSIYLAKIGLRQGAAFLLGKASPMMELLQPGGPLQFALINMIGFVLLPVVAAVFAAPAFRSEKPIFHGPNGQVAVTDEQEAA